MNCDWSMDNVWQGNSRGEVQDFLCSRIAGHPVRFTFWCNECASTHRVSTFPCIYRNARRLLSRDKCWGRGTLHSSGRALPSPMFFDGTQQHTTSTFLLNARRIFFRLQRRTTCSKPSNNSTTGARLWISVRLSARLAIYCWFLQPTYAPLWSTFACKTMIHWQHRVGKIASSFSRCHQISLCLHNWRAAHNKTTVNSTTSTPMRVHSSLRINLCTCCSVSRILRMSPNMLTFRLCSLCNSNRNKSILSFSIAHPQSALENKFCHKHNKRRRTLVRDCSFLTSLVFVRGLQSRCFATCFERVND
mmetsp:Transcript_7639/g.28638  ORF Transcript_7639/g.28638 Transcript_7639/m.28638 type:complete len:304 (-) Transcript_7639:831-1742(-)